MVPSIPNSGIFIRSYSIQSYSGIARHSLLVSRQVEQKPGGRGREYNNLPFKMHCDSIITRSCWIGD